MQRMQRMQIVINIPDDEYAFIKETGIIKMSSDVRIARAIANGIPLPKGHGRLVDEDEANNLRYKYFDFSDNEVNCIKRGIDRLTTIIEADKEVENESKK